MELSLNVHRKQYEKEVGKMLRKYTWIVAALLFLGVYSLPLQGGAAPPNLFIKTDKGCGDETWFSVGDDIDFSYMLSGAAPLSEYKYWVKIYSNTGAVLSSWKGLFKTDGAGTSSTESKKSRVSFPSGVQYAEISIPSLGILNTCTFIVLASDYTTEYEYVKFTVSLNKTTANPGDMVTLTVNVENKMEYPFYFNSQNLEVDLGELGGVVSPPSPETHVLAGTTRTVVVYEFPIPDVPEDEYSITIVYSESYIGTLLTPPATPYKSTWAACTFLSVEIKLKGTISIVSQPETLRINEVGSIVMKVTNPTLKDMTYVVEVAAPAAIHVSQTSYTLPVTHASSKTIVVPISSSEEEGYYTLTFSLFVEKRILDTTSATITVKEPPAGSLELLSPPSTIRLNESVTLKLQIKNTSRKAITYRATASASEGLILSQTSWNVSVAAGDKKILEIPVVARGASPNYINFELFYENTKISSVSWNVTVEEGIIEENMNLFLSMLAVAGLAAASMILWNRAHTQKKILRHPEEPASQDLANIYEKAGDGSTEKGNLGNAAEFYEKAGDIWRRMKNVERAVELYRKAAEIWKKLKNVGAAKRNEEKIAEVYEEAGRLSQKNGDFQKAGEFYEKAAALYRMVNNCGKSAELYEMTIKIWEKVGNKEKIRENTEKAAEAYEEVGSLAQKIEELQKTGKSQKIGEFFERAADLQREISTEKAVELYDKAARIWEKMDNKEKMKENEEKTAEIYEKIGLNADEAGIFQKAGIYYETAASFWWKTGNESRARETEEKALAAYEKANQ